ncbi:MAG: flagellar filament capping protein FliD [Treponema sp.]|nr:flagellar filament capping protein FliD [Treponema sp.]
MSDIFVPGLRSRFNTDQLVEDLMRIERIPRDRTERNIDSLESQRIWWQDLGRRITALRESSRDLFSFQNPFTDRSAFSSDNNVISATATREAVEQEVSFTVRQLAQADRFISPPLDERTTIEAGTFVFTVGNEEISFNFRGGSLREFAEAVNRRGGGRIGANVMTVQPGTRSLLLESRVTGAENRLGFSGDAEIMALRLGIIEEVRDSRTDITIDEGTVRGHGGAAEVSIGDGTLGLPSLASAYVPLNLRVEPGSPMLLRLETATRVSGEPMAAPLPLAGPDVPVSGSVTHGGITIRNNPSTAPLPNWTPPPAPPRVDDMGVLSLTFSDGSRAALPAITDTGEFFEREFDLSQIAAGRTIVALNIDNPNTHREIMVRNAAVLDPNAPPTGHRPFNAVSVAQDAIVSMEGIEMFRPSNVINDIIPGVTITARGVSDRPVRLDVQTDREMVKDAIISLVGNYNRLMAEINVLTRNDPTIIDELTYLSREEADDMRQRLGAFSGDSSLNHLRNAMIRTVTSPHPTDAGRELALLAQLGISTNARGTPGFDASRLRGYLEINESMLDAALENNLSYIRQLFGSDTTGDFIIDSGVAFHLEALARPFVEMGGIISSRTGTIDARIRGDTQRIATMDRRLEQQEMDLRIQFGRMESAFSQMEQMSTRFDNFMNSNQR